MVRIACGDTFRVKLPLKSVITPRLVPFSLMLAPMIGSLAVSVTCPESRMVCANVPKGIIRIKSRTSKEALVLNSFFAFMVIRVKVDNCCFLRR